MSSYQDKIRWWDGYRCRTDNLAQVDIMGRYPVRVQSELKDAAIAMDLVLRARGYEPIPTGPTGSYNCRYIGGTDKWSLHAYAIAIDVDYGNNPYLRGQTIERGFGTDPRFKLTEHQVEGIESIVNNDGDSIWKWLGWSIGDTMHFEADVPPDKCAVKGWDDQMEYRGVKNVPDTDWAREVVDWGIDTGVINVNDNFDDDWLRDEMTDGRFWTFLKRYDDHLKG